METSRVDGVKAPQHPNPGHWTTDFRLRHVLAQAPLDQILYRLDLRPGVGAGLALAGHPFVLLRGGGVGARQRGRAFSSGAAGGPIQVAISGVVALRA